MNVVTQTAGKQLAADKLAPDSSGSAQYLTFILAGEVFAIGILAIKEIIEYQGLTVVPMMPECIRGVINLRGSVVPVMDLTARFGKPSTAVSKRTCVVIVEVDADGERHDIGVIVDAVNAVLDIQNSEVEAAPTFGAKIRSDFIKGMGKINGKFVIILNVNHVLSPEEIGTLSEAGASVHDGNEATGTV